MWIFSFVVDIKFDLYSSLARLPIVKANYDVQPYRKHHKCDAVIKHPPLCFRITVLCYLYTLCVCRQRTLHTNHTIGRWTDMIYSFAVLTSCT